MPERYRPVPAALSLQTLCNEVVSQTSSLKWVFFDTFSNTHLFARIMLQAVVQSCVLGTGVTVPSQVPELEFFMCYILLRKT